QAMRYRALRRCRSSFADSPAEHLLRVRSREPAAVLKFGTVILNVEVFRATVATDHQRMRHRPWLRCVITHGTDDNSRLLQRLTAHGIFQSLARLHKTRQAGIHAFREMRTPPEQT